MFTIKHVHFLNIIFGLIIVPAAFIYLLGAIIFGGAQIDLISFVAVATILFWLLSYFLQAKVLPIEHWACRIMLVLNACIVLSWLVFFAIE